MEYRDIAPKVAYGFLAIIIAVFIALHAFNLAPSISDENTYFYMGSLVSQGFLPYKDFFYAHPPLNVLLLAALIKVFGFNMIVLKLIPVIASALIAVFIYLILEKAASRFAGLTAAILFLFSYQTLRVSTYVTGIETATLLIVIALYFLFSEKSRKYLYAGALLGIAGITAFFSVIAAVIIAVVLLLRNRKNSFQFLLGFFAVFAAVNILLLVFFGSSYLTPVVLYHFLKPETMPASAILLSIVKDNWLLAAAAALFLFIEDKKRVSIVALLAAAYIVFFMFYKSLFGYYTFIILPLLALLAGYSLFNVAGKLASKFNLNQRFILIALGVVIGISAVLAANKYIGYGFQDFNNAKEIAQYLAQDPHTALFGDDSTTPLLAILSGKKIAFNHADLNNFRWRTGLVDMQQTIANIRREKPLIITFQVNLPQGNLRYGIDAIDEFHNFLAKECKIEKEFTDSWQGYGKVVKVWGC